MKTIPMKKHLKTQSINIFFIKYYITKIKILNVKVKKEKLKKSKLDNNFGTEVIFLLKKWILTNTNDVSECLYLNVHMDQIWCLCSNVS